MICRRCANSISACTCPSGPVTTGVISASTALPPMAAHMTLRDWFAGMAMQGLLAGTKTSDGQAIVKDAYALADAMMAKREKTK
jgi:hypothetical protein